MMLTRKAKITLFRCFWLGTMCGVSFSLACHDPSRLVNGQVNYLANWPISIHATATNQTSNQPYVGGYSTVADNACETCHMSHNASGQARLLRGSDELACMSCH